jgi:hypothetical protein
VKSFSMFPLAAVACECAAAAGSASRLVVLSRVAGRVAVTFVGLLLRCFSCVRHELIQAVLMTSALSVFILAQVPVCLLPTARWRLRWSRQPSRPTFA